MTTEQTGQTLTPAEQLTAKFEAVGAALRMVAASRTGVDDAGAEVTAKEAAFNAAKDSKTTAMTAQTDAVTASDSAVDEAIAFLQGLKSGG